ncbi:MAG: ARC6/PARC6 family protein, partial [Sphaerospermopsis kisseleviana]
KTFDLKISLGNLETAVSSSTPEYTPTSESSPILKYTARPEYTNTSENSTDNTNKNYESNLEPNNLQPENDISQEQALELVQRWYAAKPQIFAPPFDRDLLGELATGTLYQRVGGVDGSIDWLQKYNRYYTYNKSEITNIMGFSNSGRLPYIKVRVLQELYLHGEKGIDKTNSGVYENDYIYFFAKENGIWKIYKNEKI